MKTFALALLAAASASTLFAADVHVRVDPSATHANPGNENLTTFPTIVNALDHHPFATPNADGPSGRVYIEIVPGTYKERVIVTQNHNNITLVGLGNRPSDVVITNSLNAKTARRHLLHAETVEINGTVCRVLITSAIENTAGNTERAVAVADRSDRSRGEHCRLLGHQDTLFADYGRQITTSTPTLRAASTTSSVTPLPSSTMPR